MLILRRKVGQNIVIAGHIHITVLSIQGNQIKIGIGAPSDVLILRGELKPLEKLQTTSSVTPTQTPHRRQG